MESKLSKRFGELEQQMLVLSLTLKSSRSQIIGDQENVDFEKFLQWKIKVKNLIVKACGENSQHFKEFVKAESHSALSGNSYQFKATSSVFLATKEDFQGGYLSSYKSIVQAEIFDTELEQANELLNNGYYVASAVIAGVVLETALRELCDREAIEHGKIDKMNADLAKAGIYNKIVQKQVTTYAGIRNSAAHGKINEFSTSDVKQMIIGVEHFLAVHLNS